MKYFLIILLLFCFSLTGCGNDNLIDNRTEDNNYTSSRTATTNSVTNTNIESNNTIINDIEPNNTEVELSSFTTKIYTPNDEARQTNIRITCSKLDGTIVNAR